MDFDPHSIEDCNQLLLGKEFELTWDLYDRKVTKGLPQNGEWAVRYKDEVVHLYGFEDKPVEARHRAAMFIFLRDKGIDYILARELTVCYFAGTLPV